VFALRTVARGAGRVTTPRLAVLVSGGGTTLENFVERIADGRLDAEIAVVVASKSGAYALERCKRHGLSSRVVEWHGAEHAAEFDRGLTAAVEEAGADLVCLSGFLRLWRFPDRWIGRVMNIHPGLLPEFGGRGMYGHHVHEKVLEVGAAESGCTVHVATLEYDQGPVILERRVPVESGDTPAKLAARVFEAECEAYPAAIQLFGSGRLRVESDRVDIMPAPPVSKD